MLYAVQLVIFIVCLKPLEDISAMHPLSTQLNLIVVLSCIFGYQF